MKRSTLPAVFAALILLVAQAGARQPNIIHIVADDLGWKDLGFQGASDIRTPNLDRLAREGARFEQFYVQPMCTPTRAALMTGRYPMRYGLQTLVIPSKGTYGLSTEEFLLPQVLSGAGYKTAIIGKWHLGHADRRYWQRDNEQVKEDGYVTTLLGNDAVRFVEGNKDADRPFFLYLAFTAPHTPYQAPEEYVERFRDIPDPTRRTYAAMISCLDDQVGRVVEALERTGQRDRTLILFHSDNGPLRGGKGQIYEGGTRVPAFANWPGQIPPGTVVTTPIHIVDILPTLASLAGASTEKCLPLDGLDVSPALLRGEPSARTEVV